MFPQARSSPIPNNTIIEPHQQPMLNLYITYVNKEGPFLKVWGQTDKNKSLFVEQFLHNAAKQFDEGFGEIPFSNLQVGTLVCAKSRDNKYYRARITNINYLNDSCLEVVFLDFGNQDTVLTKDVRSPQNFPPSFISLPPLATEFIFAEAHTPGGGEWNENIFEIISKELRYRDLQGQLVAQATQYYLIKLFLEGTDIGAVFINKNLLQPIPLHAQQAVLLSMSLQKKPLTPYTTSTVTANVEINSYKASVLEPLKNYQVYVSFVNDGPTLFSVQLKQSELILGKLMADINAVNLTMLEDVPLPGTICLARCLEDGNVCRAVVTNEVDNHFKVYYVDFGNYEELPLEYLYQIPFKFVLPKVMAIRLSLNGIEKSAVTMDMMLAFKKFVDNRLLRMKVLPSTKKATIHKCELYDIETNTNALDVINRAAKHAYPDSLSLNRGFVQPIKISYVYSCNRFYVQLANKEEELAKLMSDLQASCELNDKILPSELRVGLPCCALFDEDQLWYRSEILNINDNFTVQVRYIDYGNESQISIDKLRMVDGELLTVLRPQAIECCLNGYQNMPTDEKRDNLFEELILEQTFTMKVNEMYGKKALVELIDSNNYNVASLLLEKIAGTKCQASPLLVQAGNKIEHRRSVSSDSSRGSRKTSRDNFWGSKNTEKSWRNNDNPESYENANKSTVNNKQKENGWWRDNNKQNNRNHERNNRGNDRQKINMNDRMTRYKDDQKTEFSSKTYNNRTSPSGSWGNDSNKGSNNTYKTESSERPRYERKPRRESLERFNAKRGRDGPPPRDDNRNTRKNDASTSSGSERSFKQDRSRFASRNGYKNEKNYDKPSKSFDSWDMPAATYNTKIYDLAQATAEYEQLGVIGTQTDVGICWFHNPCHFYCQLQDKQNEIKQMMEDIQVAYKNRKSEVYPVNAPVIAQFHEDNVYYRARIIESSRNQFKVLFVDFGNVSIVDKVWGIEKKFMILPIQAIRCALKNIGPNGENWSDCSTFSRYFGNDTYSATFLDSNEDTINIQLSFNGENVAQQLVSDGLAKSLTVTDSDTSEIHTSLLLSQQIRVTLKSVNNLSDIIVATEFGSALKCKAHNLEIASDVHLNELKNYLNQDLIIFVDNILDNNILDVTFYNVNGTKLVILEPDEGAFEFVDPLCPLPIYKSHINGYVSHVDETSIYLQPRDCTDKLKQLRHDMSEAYESTVQESPIVPEEQFNYAVRRSSGNWYRVRVMNFNDETASVSYLDYGDIETIPLSELRELQPKFNLPNILCVQIELPSGSPASFLGKNVMAEVYFGETCWGGIVEEYILPAELEQVQQQNQIENKHPEVKRDAKSKGTPVYVSHVDSPTEFYVQLIDSQEALDELQENLQTLIPDLAALENISIGVLCAAPYSVNSEWYRAEVLDADDDITTVRFVDFGNTDVINNKTTEIKTLPSNLLSLAVYATRCSLKLKAIEDEWSQSALELFTSLIEEEDVTAEFLVQDEKTNIVELYSNGQNIKDILLERNYAMPCEIVTESKTTCFVSHSNSPSEFWVQLANCVDELEWIAEQLANAANFQELDNMSPGTLCAALFPDDEMWYRARILSNTIAGIELIFIDYGNTCVSTSLRQLPEELVVTPPLAQKCCLKRPKSLPYWTKEAQEKFIEIAAEGQTVFEIKKITTGETATIELLLNEENIIKQLLPVTKAGYIRNFESLDKFNLEINDAILNETYSLEAMPDTQWDENSNLLFLELYPKETLFDIEFTNDGIVRLYHNKNDIRVSLRGTKNNFTNFVSQYSDDGDQTETTDDHTSEMTDETEKTEEGVLEQMVDSIDLNKVEITSGENSADQSDSNNVDMELDDSVTAPTATIEQQPLEIVNDVKEACEENELLAEKSLNETSYESCEPIENLKSPLSVASQSTESVESSFSPSEAFLIIDTVNNIVEEKGKDKAATSCTDSPVKCEIGDNAGTLMNSDIEQLESSERDISITDDSYEQEIEQFLHDETVELAIRQSPDKVVENTVQQCHSVKNEAIDNVSSSDSDN